MPARVAAVLVVVGAVLALGSGAAAQSTQKTTVVVQVLGVGTITDNRGKISCGEGKTQCYAVYVGTGSVTLSAAPGNGWGFAPGWHADSDNCPAGGSATSPCTFTLDGTTQNEEIAVFTQSPPVSPQTTLTVSPAPDDGDVLGGGGRIHCGSTGSDCVWTAPVGSVVTVRPDPDPGFVFLGWTGACTDIDPVCTVPLSAAATVGAKFGSATDFSELEVIVEGDGRVTAPIGIDCTSDPTTTCVAHPAKTDGTVQLTATPAAGASFTGWSEDAPATCGTQATCNVPTDQAYEVKATFTAAPSSPPAAGTFALTVSVTGSGRVTGAGISCGNGATTCTSSRGAGTTATLTAEAAGGATFRGWGGACAGTAPTCEVTMSAARNVTATFAAPEAPGSDRETLTLRVTGAGSVSAAGGTCSSGGLTRTCAQSYANGTRVALTASPADGSVFAAWGGACSGAARTCTVTMSGARAVTATFAEVSRSPSGGRALRSRLAPLVAKRDGGYEVTLRLTATRRGRVQMRALRAGRAQTALSFAVAPGPVTIGPFPVAKAGFYVFEVTFAGGGAVRQQACVGRCGAASGAPALLLTRKPVAIARAGAIWSLTLRFHTSAPIGATVRLLRGRRLVREHRFAPDAGARSAGPFLLSPGVYTVRLSGLDAWGRRKTLTWTAVLP